MSGFLTLSYDGPVQVPEVVRTDFQLIDISEDGFVSLHSSLASYLLLGTLFVVRISFNRNSPLFVCTLCVRNGRARISRVFCKMLVLLLVFYALLHRSPSSLTMVLPRMTCVCQLTTSSWLRYLKDMWSGRLCICVYKVHGVMKFWGVVFNCLTV